MRLGMAKNLKHSTPEEWARKHSELGLRAVVFPLDSTADQSAVREYCRAAEKYDLAIAEVGVWRSMLCGDASVREANIAYAADQLRFADEIGARCCVNFIGTYNGVRTEDSPLNGTDEAFRATVDMVREVIRRASPKRTKFSLEAMRNMTPDSPEEYIRLCDAVDDPAFGVHLDPFNWIKDPAMLANSSELIDRAFDLLGDRIVSCHMKDLVPSGDTVKEVMPCKGGFDIARFAERLEAYPDLTVIVEHLESTEEYLEALELLFGKLPQLGRR